jgi:outer membrane protein
MSNCSIPICITRLLRAVMPGLVALATLVAPGVIWAQAKQAAMAPAAAPITLEQAIEYGKAKRLNMRIAEAEVDAARARLNQARALRWPTLDLTANISDINNYDSFSGATASVTFPGDSAPSSIAVTQTVPRYQTSAGLQLRYDVYAGGRINAQLNRQEQFLQTAELKRQIVLRDVALEIAQAYFKLRRACIKYDTAQWNSKRATENLSRAQQRLHNGTISALDVSEAELALTEKQVALRTSNEDMEIAQADFIAAQNDAPSATAAATPNCNFPNEISDDLTRLGKWADPSLKTRFNQLRVHAAQKAVEVEHAAFRPQVSLIAKYTGIGRNDNSYSKAFDDYGRGQASIGLDFSLKLFDGGYTQNRVAEAKAEVKRLSLVAKRDADERAQVRNRNELSVRMAQDRVELARARFELAQQQSTVARKRQDSGSGSAIAVDEQAERVRNAQNEYRLAELDLALARVATLLSSSRIQTGVPDAPDVNTDKETPDHG